MADIRLPSGGFNVRPRIPAGILTDSACVSKYTEFRSANLGDYEDGPAMLSAFIVASPECAPWARRQMQAAPPPSTPMTATQCSAIWDGWIVGRGGLGTIPTVAGRRAALNDFAAANPGCRAWVTTQLAALDRLTPGPMTARDSQSTGMSTGKMLLIAGIGVGLLWLVSSGGGGGDSGDEPRENPSRRRHRRHVRRNPSIQPRTIIGEFQQHVAAMIEEAGMRRSDTRFSTNKRGDMLFVSPLSFAYVREHGIEKMFDRDAKRYGYSVWKSGHGLTFGLPFSLR